MNSVLRIAAGSSRALLWTAALFGSQLLFAQGVHITKRAHISPSTGTNHYSDVVAESRSNGKSYAYVSSWHNTSGVWIFDVTNPDAPTYIAKYQPGGGLSPNMQGIQVLNGIGYFAADTGNGGVHIVDLSNPANPTLITRILAMQDGRWGNTVHAPTIDPAGQHLYIPGYPNDNSIFVYDVSNPAQPSLLTIFYGSDTLVHDVTVSNNGNHSRLFASGWHGTSDIFDISNPQTPVLLGTFPSGTHTQDVSVSTDGNFLACPRELVSNGEVGIFDISDPSHPVRVATITQPAWGINATSPSTSKIMGNYLFVAWYQQGLMIFDIGNLGSPSKPILVGNYDTWPGFSFGGSGGGDGDWGVWPFLGMDRVLISDRTTGLYIFDATGVSTAPGVFSLNYSPASVLGGNSTTGTVGLVGIAPTNGVTVDVTSSSPAVNPASVSIPAGAHVASFSQSTGPVNNTTNVNLTASDGTFSAPATLTLTPPQTASVLISPSPIRGGLNATGKVTLTGPVQSDSTVPLTITSGASAIASMPTSVVVPAGFSSATWTIQTNQITANTVAKISATFNGVTKTGSFTVSAIIPSGLSFSPTSVAGGATTTGKVTFPAPLSQNTVVTLAVVSGGSAVASIPASITVPAGNASGTFVVNTKGVSATTMVKISAQANGGTKSATFSVH